MERQADKNDVVSGDDLGTGYVDFENIIPAMDRILLITWLLKDFGWMSTNIYLGWSFGLCAILFHLIHLLIDPRKTFRFYNLSVLLWVTGEVDPLFSLKLIVCI
jgi:hypothetical protein